jgi:hypothetical protein
VYRALSLLACSLPSPRAAAEDLPGVRVQPALARQIDRLLHSPDYWKEGNMRRLRHSASIILATIITLTSFILPGSVLANGSSVSISPALLEVENGASFTIDLVIDTDIEVRGWQVDIVFDPAMVQCTGMTIGSFIQTWATANGGSTMSMPAVIDNTNGLVGGINCMVLASEEGGATGTGTLCTISFAAQPAVDDFCDIVPFDVRLGDADGWPIHGITASGCVVTIGDAGERTPPAPKTVTGTGDKGESRSGFEIAVYGDDPIAAIVQATEDAFESEYNVDLTINVIDDEQAYECLEDDECDIATYTPIIEPPDPPPYNQDNTDDGGRSCAYGFEGDEENFETVVVGASSYYHPALSRGGERIRVWSRLEEVRDWYGPSYDVWVASTEFHLLSNDERNYPLNMFVMYSTEPGENAGPSFGLLAVAYDILNFAGIPTNLVHVIANNLLVDEITQSGVYANDWTLWFNRDGLDEDVVDLPMEVAWYEADSEVHDSLSGVQAMFRFNWELPEDQDSIEVLAGGRVQYGCCFLPYPACNYYFWSKESVVEHVING